MTDYLQEYAKQIRTGKIKTSKRVKRVYLRLAKEASKPPARSQFVYSLEHANYPIEFIERYLRHSKGKWAGRPIELELFQKAFIAVLFGFINKQTGKRRFRRALLMVGRKNGKSTLAAAIMLFLMIADGEGGAEIYSVATKRDQARIIFREAANMVSQSPELRAVVVKHVSDLEYPATFARFEALSSEAHTLDGLNSHGIAIDELHAIKGMELYEVMDQSTAARDQSLLLMTTTAGTVRESIFDERYEYACKVADWKPGFKDWAFLPVLYELDEIKEWTDPQMWIKANPGLGAIKPLEYLKQAVDEAKRSPRKLNGVLCKEFNMRQNAEGSWLSWNDIENKATFDLEDLRDTYAVGGADLSSTTDLTCATLIVVRNDIKYVIQQYFLPEATLAQRAREDKVPYDLWQEWGYLTACPGARVDYSMVTDWYVKMREQHGIYPLWVGYDPYNAQYWTQEMEQNGFTMDIVRQGAQTMSSPMKELGAELTAKRVNYNRNPILEWCLLNTNEKRDINDNIRPVKGRSSLQRIDGATSLIDAYVVYLRYHEEYTNMQGG